MPLHALLYRRQSEPQTIEIDFDGSVYAVRVRRHRQARRYTLRIQAATREVILTIPPRGTLKEAEAFARKHGGWVAARLGRLPEAAPFADGVVVPLRGVPHRIAHRHGGAARCGPRPAATASVCYASPVTRRISTGASAISAPRSQARARSREPPLRACARSRHPPRDGARSVEPLGLLFDDRRAVVFLAAHPGADAMCSIISPRTKSPTSSR